MLVFCDKQELEKFIQGTDSRMGYSYEWEGEDVVHLHLEKLLHGFGLEGRCLFTCDRGVLENRSLWNGCSRVLLVTKNEDGSLACAESYIADGESLVQEKLEFIPARSELYSRSQGILEVGTLAPKRVMIVGLGSFGSQIAVELAKAGVGQFALMDFDRVELHNLMRHTCGVNDLGRLKTDALYDSILGKNPYAVVDKFPIDINENQELLEAEVAKADLIICATDNNRSRFNLSNAVVKFRKTCIFGRANTRAAGGDVFRYVPGGPCYNCLLGNSWYASDNEEITNVDSARRNGQIAAYVSEEDANAVVQVGLSADIAPICNMMVKLSLVELSRGTESGIASLEEELVYDYYMWANRRENRFANWVSMPGAGAKPTILRWYGAHIQKIENCTLCGESDEMELDEGEEMEEMLKNLSNA